MKIRILSIFSLLLIYINCVFAHVSENTIKIWQDNKLAMKIIFPVQKNQKGKATNDEFNFAGFNADSIVSLAVKSGMRTVIAPAKTGNMYLFNTSTDTNSCYHKYNHRDIIKELSVACAKRKIQFGLYLPISVKQDNNSYPTSGKLNELGKKRITELLTKYGKISEISFDMIARTPEESKEL